MMAERSRMAQIFVIGRITHDLNLKTSEKNNAYVRFDIAENIGSGQNMHPQYFQVCAWNEDAHRLVNANAKQGSLIWITGSLELEPYTKQDGITIDKRMKIMLDNWGFVPTTRSKYNRNSSRPKDSETTLGQESEVVDGDRDS